MSELYHYIFIFALFYLLELLYFRIAGHFNIIDRPNKRSSHTEITIRGGGIIFALASIIYFFVSGFNYPFFTAGLFLISSISFADDIKSVPNKTRIIVHLLSVALLFLEASLFSQPVFVVIIAFVVVIGTINAYNFMDGINGMTGAYSLVVISTLLVVNQLVNFADSRLLFFILISLIVFLLFNFRRKARCFAGDVGSVSMAFIVLFLLIVLTLQTGQLLYILFLSVYGVDSVLTILYRIKNKENIFNAHRSHLYQLLCNEKGFSHLRIACMYALVQLGINSLVILVIRNLPTTAQTIAGAILLICLSVAYFIITTQIRRKIVCRV